MRKIDRVASLSMNEGVIKRTSENTHCQKNKSKKVPDHFTEELIKETSDRHFIEGQVDSSPVVTTSYSSSRSGVPSPSLSLASHQSLGSQRESLEKLRESFDKYFERKNNRTKIQAGNGTFNCRICEREDFANKKHLDFHIQTFHNQHFQ